MSTRPGATRLSLVVEGYSDAPIVSRIVRDHGFEVAQIHGLRGKPYIDQKLSAFNSAARFGNWLVVRDLDHDADCAAAFVGRVLARPSVGMRFRIAVRAIEAWLLADEQGMSAFFHVDLHEVPHDPERLKDPKAALVALARRSKTRAIREDMVPANGTTARVGPGFVSRIAEFADSAWSWKRASKRSDSLRRCVERVAAWRR